MQFKQALDNDEYIYPLFKSLEREKRAVPENISVRKASAEDAVTAAELACKMWRDASAEELTESLSRIISGDSGAVFILEADGADVGFAQCQLRNDYVEGTESSPVGYLEGVYIEPLYRRNGGASALLEMCEIWAREQGCTEFASDCEADNEASRLFHLGAGFTEANRIICFTKKL
ncbi:MAG: GNAT family N-acetyltransferase [Oscillospiraceae bacterium]|nr:GNAT family N-acetyltransferase [Oscillospiraceae bacterium]